MKAIILFLLVLISFHAIGQCDELDPSYYSGGVLNVNIGNQSGTNDNVVATFVTDEHIIVVGNALFNTIKQGGVAYFNHDGQYLKKTKIGISQFASYDYTVQAACLQHDGKLLVTGHLGFSFGKGPVFVARVNVDGTMDTSFGNNGIVSQNITGNDFNFMSNIIQHPDGSISAIGRARPHGGDLKAIKVTVDSIGAETSSTVFNFSAFSTFSLYEFINDFTFRIDNSINEVTIRQISGEPFPLSSNGHIVIDITETKSRITGLSILSNNRLAAYGYTDINSVNQPVVYIFDEDGNPDTSFNGSGYKLLNQSTTRAADIVLVNDVYYLTTVQDFSGATIVKINLDGTTLNNSVIFTNPLIKGGSILMQDSTILIAGEIRVNSQSDFGIVKYRVCDYKETIFEDYPFKSIGELKEIDHEGLPVLKGDFSTLGVISSINFSSDHRAFISIMDDEDEGIFISGDTTDYDYLPKLGDEILVSGILQSHYESTAELFWKYYRIESKNNEVTQPIEVDELNTYSEGVYVRLDNVSLLNTNQWKGDGSTFSVTATDGANSFKIKIFENSYWSDKPAPEGMLIVSGIGGQDDPTIPYLNNFEIYPQTEMDITISTNSEETEINSVYIYPNPSSDKLFIDNLNLEKSSLKLYDVSGNRYNIQFNKNAIDISSLTKGMYLLNIESKDGQIVKTHRFVKQ